MTAALNPILNMANEDVNKNEELMDAIEEDRDIPIIVPENVSEPQNEDFGEPESFERAEIMKKY